MAQRHGAGVEGGGEPGCSDVPPGAFSPGGRLPQSEGHRADHVVPGKLLR